jgi:hypothetical protein
MGYAALNSFVRTGTAVSSEAREIRNAACVVVNFMERSHALFGAKAVAITQIRELARECSESGWDGEDASPLHPAVVDSAVEFVRTLPDTVALPEFAPEPDGAISLDWIQSRTRIFSVSVNASNRLSYAWLDGGDRGHGVADFDGLTIPSRVLQGIKEIMSRDSAAVRVA